MHTGILQGRRRRFTRAFALLAAALVMTACTSRPATQAERPQSPSVPPAQETPAVAPAESEAQRTSRTPIVIEGTGGLVGSPTAPQQTGEATGDGFQLNFMDTDIATVVSTVLGDGLNVPFVIDPQVKGTMTLQATRALSRDEVLVALESALRVQGAALVNVHDVYHVVPIKDASQRITNLRIPGTGGRGFGIYIVPLQYVSAAEMQRILQPFAPEGGILRVDASRNMLLLAGTTQEITTLLNVVKTFDVDWLAGMSFAMYPLEYVDAETLSNELGAVFAGANSPIAGVVRLVPMSRLNSLLVVTTQPKYLKDVEAWIRRLDLGVTAPGRRIYVYDVQNSKADDLAETLNRILMLDGGVESGVSRVATPTGSPTASPSDSGVSITEAPRYGPASATRIVPNAENNSLLIFATPSEFAVIEAALKRLDVVPIQVLIEASIAEVTLTDDLRYGLQWAYQGGDGPLILSEASSGTINQQFPGFSYLFTGRTDIRAVLNAIESLTDVRVISSPKLLVLNNREAQLQVGDQVPIAVQSAVGVLDPDAPIVNSVQFRDTGVILRVTPRANRSGRVTLEVAQEVSDVVPTTTSGIDSPTIQQRKISSTVTVGNGETVALGGLIRDTRSRTRTGIPYLRRIPVFGDLFGSTDKGARRTELIVLLTPRVVRSEAEAEAMMDDLREQFRGLKRLVPGWDPESEPIPPDPPPPSP